MNKLLLAAVVIFAIGCGTITMNMDTEVSSIGEMTHDLEVTMESPLVPLMDLTDEELADIPEDCAAAIDGDVLTLTCDNLTQDQLEEGEIGFDIQVIQTETDEGTEYRVTMPYPFPEEEFATADDEFDLGFDPEDLLDLSFAWNVEVPGQIDRGRSNADSYSGSTAKFETVLGEQKRETLEVVSLVKAGGGACSAPY